MRIFRVVREKIHVEESQLPGYVMIPAKEIKLLTYQLLENNFIQLQELRKSMATNAPTKSFYLFYVDLNQVGFIFIQRLYCMPSTSKILQYLKSYLHFFNAYYRNIVYCFAKVARMVAETSRKALANAFTRKNFESTQNKRLLEKQVKGVSIVYEF